MTEVSGNFGVFAVFLRSPRAVCEKDPNRQKFLAIWAFGLCFIGSAWPMVKGADLKEVSGHLAFSNCKCGFFAVLIVLPEPGPDLYLVPSLHVGLNPVQACVLANEGEVVSMNHQADVLLIIVESYWRRHPPVQTSLP